MVNNEGATISTRLRDEMRLRLRLRRLIWVGCWAGLLGLLFLFCAPCFAASQELAPQNPNKVKAAFIRNFAHYVRWPADAFTDEHSPWGIGILGSDPFGQILEETFNGRTEQGRPFEIFRADTLDKLPPCQIIFVSYQDAVKRRALLSELRGKPVLTVGDAPDFLQEGGVIRFQVSEYVKFSVNLDQARSVSLKIGTKMLEVSHEVVENNTSRRRR